MVSVVPENRPELPVGPPKLNSYDLKRAQGETLSTPRMKYGLFARALFLPVDLLYGKRGSLAKFAVIEVVARVPYQAWERVGYRTVHRHASRSALAKRIFDRIVEARSDQDNEQWHLLILRDLIQREGIKQGWFMHRVIPFLMAMVFYHISWILFLLKPARSYRLNAEFEDHAEHEYMTFVAEHPELEELPDPGTYAGEYGHYRSVADLLRQIGHDERVHKEESLERLQEPRPVEPVHQPAA